jgi:hypothetical protein
MPGGDPSEELAALLRVLKARTNRSYDALARRIGASSSALHRYCSGAGVPPRYAVLEEFARECRATEEELLELHRRWIRADATARAQPNGAEPELEAPEPADDGPTPGPEGRVEVRPGPSTAVGPGPASSAPVTKAGRGRRWARRPSGSSVRWLVPLAGLVAVGVLVSGASRLPSWTDASGSRRPSCSEPEEVNYRDRRVDGRVWRNAWSCPNTRGAHVYADPDPGQKIGIMDTGYSWFVCWASGARQGDGSTVWYYTQGDRSLDGTERLDAWGYMPSTAVRISSHPWPGMPTCPS